MGVRVRGSHTYANITDENLCARNLRIVGLVQKVRNFDASKISTFTVCPMIITVNVEIFDGCLISFFSSLDSTHEIKYIRGCTTPSHTYVNITDENLCARNLRIVGLVQKVRNFDASKISTFTVCPMIITVNVEIFDGCLISFFSSLDSTHEIKYIRGCTTTISHTYVNITDENLCARNLRIVGLVQKVRNFDASKISTFTVCPMIITVNVEIFDGCLISFFSSIFFVLGLNARN